MVNLKKQKKRKEPLKTKINHANRQLKRLEGDNLIVTTFKNHFLWKIETFNKQKELIEFEIWANGELCFIEKITQGKTYEYTSYMSGKTRTKRFFDKKGILTKEIDYTNIKKGEIC